MIRLYQTLTRLAVGKSTLTRLWATFPSNFAIPYKKGEEQMGLLFVLFQGEQDSPRQVMDILRKKLLPAAT